MKKQVLAAASRAVLPGWTVPAAHAVTSSVAASAAPAAAMVVQRT